MSSIASRFLETFTSLLNRHHATELTFINYKALFSMSQVLEETIRRKELKCNVIVGGGMGSVGLDDKNFSKILVFRKKNVTF